MSYGEGRPWLPVRLQEALLLLLVLSLKDLFVNMGRDYKLDEALLKLERVSVTMYSMKVEQDRFNRDFYPPVKAP